MARREGRMRRHRRVRSKISGTAECPRFNVYRSLDHIYVQVIDDTAGNTLVAASTLDKDVVTEVVGLTKTDAAKVVGRVAAERALGKGITAVVFDRGGFQYHGRVQALAEAAREAGLKF